MNGTTQAPCKGCEKRHFGCHAECAEYQAYTTERARYRAIKATEQDYFSTKSFAMRKWFKSLERDIKNGRM